MTLSELNNQIKVSKNNKELLNSLLDIKTSFLNYKNETKYPETDVYKLNQCINKSLENTKTTLNIYKQALESHQNSSLLKKKVIELEKIKTYLSSLCEKTIMDLQLNLYLENYDFKKHTLDEFMEFTSKCSWRNYISSNSLIQFYNFSRGEI
jgi:hypothetical protein